MDGYRQRNCQQLDGCLDNLSTLAETL